MYIVVIRHVYMLKDSSQNITILGKDRSCLDLIVVHLNFNTTFGYLEAWYHSIGLDSFC